MLECRSLTVRFGQNAGLVDVSLTVSTGSTTAVMGASGSGKSTLLRTVAGLQTPLCGQLHWMGSDVTDVPPHRRGFGFMFQNYALFPHLDVGANIAFGLRMQGDSRRSQRLRTAELLELVGLSGYEGRMVDSLSGGEQQRVALARTLAPEPGLILLDEPIGALDRARRDQLQRDMQRTFTFLGVTAIYVTHDHEEAAAVADQIVVLDQAMVVAAGTPHALWHSPPNTVVAALLGFPVLRAVPLANGIANLGGAEVPVDAPDGLVSLALLPGALTLTGDSDDMDVMSHRFVRGQNMATVEIEGEYVDVNNPTGIATRRGGVRWDSTRVRVVSD